MYCPICGAASQSANAYCKRCGEWLPDMKSRSSTAFGGETPQQNIFTSLFLSALSTIAALFSAIALYATYLGSNEAKWSIYVAAAFCLCIAGWQASNFLVTLKLRQRLKKGREDPAPSSLKAESSAPALAAAEMSAFVDVPSVTDDTTQRLSRSPLTERDPRRQFFWNQVGVLKRSCLFTEKKRTTCIVLLAELKTPESNRFCRSCGADLRAVSRAMSKSLPVKIASTLDAYLENRFQRNLSNGVLNVIAFVALAGVGLGYLIWGWTLTGLFLLGLGFLSLFLGIWDIWIYRRNLPLIAKESPLSPSLSTNELDTPHRELSPPLSVAEPTTKRLDFNNKSATLSK